MKKLGSVDYALLSELMHNAKRSDRKIATILGVSQSTVTRKRAKLEKHLHLKYTAIPELEKIGIGIIVFILGSWKPEARTELIQGSKEYIKKVDTFVARHPNIIFTSSGQGLDMTGITISLHKNYSDYLRFRREYELEWGMYLKKIDVFIVSVDSDVVQRVFSFQRLGRYLKDIQGFE